MMTPLSRHILPSIMVCTKKLGLLVDIDATFAS
jgi:hypothetical protein